jgi:hypothetical protein
VRAIEAAALRDEHRCITTSPASAPNSTVMAANCRSVELVYALMRVGLLASFYA